MVETATTTTGGAGIQEALSANEQLIVLDGVQIWSTDASTVSGDGGNVIFVGADAAVISYSGSGNDAAIFIDENIGVTPGITVAEGASVIGQRNAITSQDNSTALVNAGLIQARNLGADLIGDGSRVVNDGLVASAFIGLRVWDFGDIANNGTVSAESFGLVLRQGSGRVVNTGEVSADTAVYMGDGSGSTAPNMFTNTGEVIGESTGLRIVGQSAWINNSGTIAATTLGSRAVAIDFPSLDAFYQLTNSGTIQSAGIAYRGAGASDVIYNTGDIIGAIELDAGDDVYQGRQGRAEGPITGGDGADTITGGDEGNDILGGDQDDVLRGRGGEDDIDGDDGEDLINGGAGDDDLSGGTGDDTVMGKAGDDDIAGGDGLDVLRGNAGDDTMFGGAGGDDIRGHAGDDVIGGGRGADLIVGGRGDDTLTGGQFTDTFVMK
ncbi:MAG: calcium-binding protein, partial [Pseudomonadota bacterium]